MDWLSLGKTVLKCIAYPFLLLYWCFWGTLLLMMLWDIVCAPFKAVAAWLRRGRHVVPAPAGALEDPTRPRTAEPPSTGSADAIASAPQRTISPLGKAALLAGSIVVAHQVTKLLRRDGKA